MFTTETSIGLHPHIPQLLNYIKISPKKKKNFINIQVGLFRKKNICFHLQNHLEIGH